AGGGRSRRLDRVEEGDQRGQGEPVRLRRLPARSATVNEVARLQRVGEPQLVALGLSHELDQGRRLRLPAEAADAAVRHHVGAPAYAIGLRGDLGQDRAVEDVVDQ